MVPQRPHDPSSDAVRLPREAVDEVEHVLKMTSMADVSGEHERPIARRPVVEGIDEPKGADDVLQRLQLAVDVADDPHPLCAGAEELRDVAVRSEDAFRGHILDADVLHLEHMQFVRRESDDEPAPGEVVAGSDVRLAGKQVAQVVVDGGIVLHVQLLRQPQTSPVLHECRGLVRDVRHHEQRSVPVHPQAGAITAAAGCPVASPPRRRNGRTPRRAPRDRARNGSRHRAGGG